MEATQKSRIHPLTAGAAVAVIIVSAVGVAAMTGHLPGSKAENAPTSLIVASLPPTTAMPVAAVPVAPVAAVPVAPLPIAALPVENAVNKPTAYDSSLKPQDAAASQSTVALADPVCANCGVVRAVNRVKHKGKGGYVGMIGGGVVGALVGSQIGHGGGRTVAELAGAGGGAYVGNEIEKRVNTTTAYLVVVHMENGSSRTFSYAGPPGFAVGSRVRVKNGTLVQE